MGEIAASLEGNFLAWLIVPLCLAAGLASQASTAPIVRSYGPFDVTFYNNGDSDGTYVGAQDWTELQMSDVGAAFATWSNRLAHTPGRQLVVRMLWGALGSGTLGATSNSNYRTGTYAWTYTEHAYRDGGTLASSSGYDFRVRFGTGITWNFGEGSPGSGQYDFRSVALHEVGHPLGFWKTYNYSTDKFGDGLSTWESKLIDPNGNNPAVSSTGAPGNFNETSNGVYFTGSHAKALNGGSNVRIYAPSTYSGSSLSHLSEATFPNALMSPQIGSAQTVRTPTALEWEMMKDMGWVVRQWWSKGAGSLAWGVNDNWDHACVPNNMSELHFTNTGLSAGDTLDLGTNRSLATLVFETTTDFTIGGAAGVLCLAKGNIQRLNTSSGVQTIARPVELGAAGVWDVAGSERLEIAAAIGGGYSLEKMGTGTLRFSGTDANTYSGATTVSWGTLELDKTGANAIAGNLTIGGMGAGGTVRLRQPDQIANSAALAIGSKGTLDLNGQNDTIRSFAIDFDGTLTGGGNLTATGASVWSGGTMDGIGKTIIDGETLTMSSSSVYLYRTLENNGTVTWSGSGGIYGDRSGAAGMIDNKVGATFDVKNNSSLYYLGYTRATFNNAGLFKKSAGTGTTTVEWTFNNTGTLDVQSGTLNLAGGGTGSGAFRVSATRELGFTGGTHDLGSATFTNAGTLNFSGGAANFTTPAFTNTGTVNFSGATVGFSGATTLPGVVIVSSGTVNVNGDLLFTGAATQSGGTLAGIAKATFENLVWSGGTMSGAGTTQIPVGRTLVLSGSADKYLFRTLDNYGTASWTGTGYFRGDASGTFNNRAGATFDAQGDTTLYYSVYPPATFNNAGLFKKTAGTGTTSVQWTFNNTGTVDVQSGTLSLSGGVAQHVGNMLDGGAWRIGGNAALNITTGSAITVNKAVVTLDGPNATFTKISGLAENQGDFIVTNGRNFTTAGALKNLGLLSAGTGSTLTVNGLLTMDWGGFSGAGTIEALSGDKIAGSLIWKFGTGTLNLAGPQSWSDGANLSVTNGTVHFNAASGVTTVAGPAGLSIFEGAQVYLEGEGDPLTDSNNPTKSVNVLNDGWQGLNVIAGVKRIGTLDGQGTTTICAGARLTAKRIRQWSLVLDGSDASDPGVPSGLGDIVPSTPTEDVAIAHTGTAVSLAGGMSEAGPTQATPEPGTLVLLALAGGVLVWRRKK